MGSVLCGRGVLQSVHCQELFYFLQNYEKSKVYGIKPNTIEALEGNIKRAVSGQHTEIIEKIKQ